MPLYDQEGQDLEAPERERKARRQQRLQTLSLWATFFFSAAVAFASSMQACYTRRYTDYAGKQFGGD